MPTITDNILRRVRAHGRGKWVCSPSDFLDLGSRAAIDQALSRFAAAGTLRRVGRGLYDLPRTSTILGGPAPADVDAAIAAIARCAGARIMPDGLAAANQLGLTTAVSAKLSYVTDGPTRTLDIDGRTIYLRHASARTMRWADRPSGPVVQALRWLGRDVASDPQVAAILGRRLPDSVKTDLT